MLCGAKRSAGFLACDSRRVPLREALRGGTPPYLAGEDAWRGRPRYNYSRPPLGFIKNETGFEAAMEVFAERAYAPGNSLRKENLVS